MATTAPGIATYIGDDMPLVVTVEASDASGPVDITGWHVQAILHANGSPSVVFHTWDNGSNGGLVLTTPASGVLTITVARANTVNLLPGTYQLLIQRTDSGFEKTLTLIQWTLLLT